MSARGEQLAESRDLGGLSFVDRTEDAEHLTTKSVKLLTGQNFDR